MASVALCLEWCQHTVGTPYICMSEYMSEGGREEEEVGRSTDHVSSPGTGRSVGFKQRATGSHERALRRGGTCSDL